MYKKVKFWEQGRLNSIIGPRANGALGPNLNWYFQQRRCLNIVKHAVQSIHRLTWGTYMRGAPGLDINVCPIPVKTDVGQVDLVLRLSDGTSEKIRFPNVPVRQTNLFPLV